MGVRRFSPGDESEVLALMRALWGHATIEDDIEPLEVWVWADADGSVTGFASASLRDWAAGCESRPAPFLEGWFVAEHRRRGGVGAALVGAVEDWARSLGHTDLGSDTWLDNDLGRQAHEALGFEEVERVISYRKSLS
ncbi:MAG TPA: GNAT family N-acetyltransferase [Acidimicrobiales bacterium]|nr:GNAT family N-acetyltransferase [Acidimicrobiales bacterium]